MADNPAAAPPAALAPASAPPSGATGDAGHVAPEGGIFRRLFIPVVAVAVVIAGVALVMTDWDRWIAGAARQYTDDAAVAADVTTLSARVGGNIVHMPVKDYDHVRQGDLIAVVDPGPYNAAVEGAKANRAAAQASLDNLANQILLQEAVVQSAIAQNASAQAQFTQASEENQRQTALGDATSRQLQQQAQAAYLQAQAAVRATAAAIEQQKAQLKVLDGQRPLLAAQVDAAQASFDNALLQLSYTRITAPFDGVVSRKLLQEGDYVGAGASIISVVPLPQVYVTANFKETQLQRMIPGRPATVTIDTFPGAKLRAKVARLSPASGAVFALLPPDNATGNYTKVVQRIPVRIEFEPGQPLLDHLRPGMSATVTVETPEDPAP